MVSYEESHYRQSRYMANVAGAGFDAHVVRKFSHLKKKGRKNRWIYTWCLVRQFFRYKSTGMKVWVDDRLVYNNLLLSIAIGICKYNGGGMQQLPEAVADDGMLDVSLIRPVHFWHLLFRFHYLFNGGIYRIRHILQERGSRIRIESSPEISVEVDGELLGETPLEFSILHKAIRIVVSKEFYDKRPETSCSCTVPEVWRLLRRRSGGVKITGRDFLKKSRPAAFGRAMRQLTLSITSTSVITHSKRSLAHCPCNWRSCDMSVVSARMALKNCDIVS